MAEREADVNVNVQKQGIPWWVTAAATLGVGSALAFYIIPRQMSRDDKNQTFIQTELVTTLKATSKTQAEQTVALQQLALSIQQQTAGQQQQAAAMNMFLPQVADNIAATRELTARLRPLTSKLDSVGDALLQRSEQEQAEADQ